MHETDSPAFRFIAAKGELSGILRVWFGSGEDDRSPFVLTLMPQYLARALNKAIPVTLEEAIDYVCENKDWLKVIAQRAKERGRTAEILD
jgi:hypothetical protein